MKLRDKIDGPMMRKLSEDEILETLGVAFLIAIVDINERVIALTDDLIISFDNFLKEFPKEAERYISKRVGKRYGGVLKYENSVDKEMLNVLTKSPSVNFELMGALMNEDPEIMAKRYKHT
ncbi:hypothetical protein FLM52_09770 [bacterium Scap17]|nr:hypothetical protein [bacterium Scap17]